LTERIGDYVETYTGKQFWPLDPRPEDVCIEDIAHSLSMQCRFNGHCSSFYSVAEHSVIVAKELEIMGYGKEVQLYGLLHDAAEAYICDLPRPLKNCIVGYNSHELYIQSAIYEAFNIDCPSNSEQLTIKHVDDVLLKYEGRHIMPNKTGWAGKRPNHCHWVPSSLICGGRVRDLGLIPGIAKDKFIYLFNKLTKELKS